MPSIERLDVTVAWTENTDGLDANGGWQITNNGRRVRFNVEDSGAGYCANVNPNIQSGTAEGIFTVNQDAQLTASVSGLGEPVEKGFEIMEVFVNEILIAQGQNDEIDIDPGCDVVVTPECCESVPIVQTILSTVDLVAGTTYQLKITFTTTDATFHVGAFYQTDLAFIPL